MKCLYTFWAPGPERQWATINKEPSWAACSSRVRPAEGANAGSERGGRQPSGQLLNPVGSDTSWAVTECWGRSPSCPLVFGSTVRDLQRSENSPEEWSWEDEERRKEALDRSCPTDKRVRGFKIWQGSWKQNGVSFDHSQTLYWRNPTSKKHHHPAVVGGRGGSVPPCFHCVRSGWRKPRYLILRKGAEAYRAMNPQSPWHFHQDLPVSRESWILGKILERISDCWLRTKPVTSNDSPVGGVLTSALMHTF